LIRIEYLLRLVRNYALTADSDGIGRTSLNFACGVIVKNGVACLGTC